MMSDDSCTGSNMPLVAIAGNKHGFSTCAESSAVNDDHDQRRDRTEIAGDFINSPPTVGTCQQPPISQGPSVEPLCYYTLPAVFMEPCVRCRQTELPPHRQCVHVVFLISFVLFLVIGVALTCLGFLDYDAGGTTSKAFRVLGIVALLLCIGFLIAACVILSDCVTSAIKAPIDDEYGYHALYPTYSDSFNSMTFGDRPAVYANCGHPVLIPAPAHASISTQQLAMNNFQPVSATLCASCSCQLLAPVANRHHPTTVQSSASCPHSIVHFTKDGHVNVAAEKLSSETNSSYLFDIPSEDEETMHNCEEPRDWV